MALTTYVALCLIVPAAWGVAMYHAFDWFARRRASAKGRDSGDHAPEEQPPIDYSI